MGGSHISKRGVNIFFTEYSNVNYQMKGVEEYLPRLVLLLALIAKKGTARARKRSITLLHGTEKSKKQIMVSHEHGIEVPEYSSLRHLLK